MDCYICGDEEIVRKNHNPYQPKRVQEMMPEVWWTFAKIIVLIIYADTWPCAKNCVPTIYADTIKDKEE